MNKTGTSFFDIKKNASSEEFPNLFARYIQSHGDVYFWEKGNFHVVTKAQHAREVLMSPDYSADRGSFFISRMPEMDLSLISDFFSVVKKMMVMSDDKDHQRRRKLASLGFEDQVLEKFSAVMKETVRELVQRQKGKAHIEFVQSISKELPATVLADLFSIPQEDRSLFLRWSNTMTGFFGGASQYRNEDGIAVNEAAKSLKLYFTGLVAERKQNAGDDYVSLLVGAQDEIGLTDDELISQLIMMLVAGMATTTDQINNNMFLFATNPSIQNEVRNDLTLLPQALEEFKRFDPAVTFIFRVARNKAQIGEQLINSGDVIFISSHAINRDLPPEENPFELNIHRKGNHFAYGYGAHYCIGAKLARMEMNHLFHEIFSVLPPLEIDQSMPSVRDHYSLSFSGFKNLNLSVRH